MKFFLSLIFLILLSCSFDTKTGIWENSSKEDLEKVDRFKGFENFYTSEKSFKKIIKPNNDLKINVEAAILNLAWLDEYYQSNNNLVNFSYNNSNQLLFKSKKITRNQVNKKLFFENNHAVITDTKGNIIVYSVNKKQIIFKFNFYKKKIKRGSKSLNLIIEKNVIYVSDNLGYLYALDYLTGKVLWAKNYKVPYRSNIKLFNNKIILSDINNSLHFVNKLNGEKISSIPTEETVLKNNFSNSIALDKNLIFYLNTYGSLYSIDKNTQIKWFLNLKKSLDENSSNLFYSNPIVLSGDKMIISTDPYLYILRADTGSTFSKIAITSIFKPIVSKNNIFLITKDNLLVCLELKTGSIIYSIEINQEIANYLDTKKRTIDIKSVALANDNLFLYLNNSYFVQFSLEGNIKNIKKLPAKMLTSPIFIDSSLIYLNNKNRLVIIN